MKKILKTYVQKNQLGEKHDLDKIQSLKDDYNISEDRCSENKEKNEQTNRIF